MSDTPSTINVRPPAWALIFAVIIGGCFYLYGKNMEINAPSSSPFLVSVSADAKVSGAPDVATASFGVQTGRQSSAKVAIDVVKKDMTKVLATVKDTGIPDKDISTESFWLSPSYDYVNGSQVPRGFEASQSLTVKIRDLDKIGDTITAATSAGANRVGNIDLTIDNPDSLKAQARSQAIDKAKAKAQELAKNLGMSIVKLTNFSEDGSYPQPPRAYDKLMMGATGVSESTPLPVPVGQQDITSSVTLTYELR